ncbi:FapA family protein [Thermaerobacillus caldiproteolyticus]|uniref:RNA-binding protein KhpB N-terminal domain-containing protein n=1 Tax=Thermaerobacillus caldiproteolyticus TaxID=247480 RepID=A0A7V9Z780_9BACL|nr:FapA family protein [Anoxybacillus caldiproteolyticus]MBA2875234.1 hypothetical protein [Anoxybacillus caldiproteolyticus]QPA32825.1 FapA family protein [Anoxybacillus caldiproteolyticus]
MGQTIISKGRNIEEAINIGLEILKSTREEVLIEIIQKETKGILRIGSKPAIVKLTKTQERKKENKEELREFNSVHDIEEVIKNLDFNSHVSMTDEKQEIQKLCLQDELEGKVWVKNGKIFCKPSPLHYPTITVGRGVKLFKNNELVTGTTVVTETDQFDIKVEEEVTETKWNITIDRDKLNVILHIEPGMRKSFTIKDIEPDYHIELNAEEHIEIRNDLQYEQILQELETLNVVRGIDFNEIKNAVNTKKISSFIIARGIKPKEGKNGWIELKVNVDIQQMRPKLREDGTVDFRELKNIPTVRKGQVIAIVHPPVPGLPGMTVTNEPIPAQPTYPVKVQLGKGVTTVENGTKIVATETGRPYFEQKGMLVQVSIIEKFIHQGDVDIASGNIRFKGDVDILGNVEDGMSVEADGNITIFKNVNRANIISKQAIFIRQNVIGSQISSGKNNILISELVHLLSIIEEHIEKLILSIKQLMASSAFKVTDLKQNGLFPLIKLLLSHKFRVLVTTTKQYMEVSKKGNRLLEQSWLDLSEQFRLCFFAHVPNEWHSLEQLTILLANIRELVNKSQTEDNQNSYVELLYALNSTIYCSGDVAVLGQGCYNCKIHAGGSLKINGVVRGGEVYARLGATIKETGSETGVLTRIIVPSDQTIKIELAREGTVIQIGKVKYTFQKEQHFVEASLNEKEQIVFN